MNQSEAQKATVVKVPTLLIVDDEEDLRQIMVEEFSKLPINVLQASNAKQVDVLLEKHKVDAILSDVKMPGGGGIELLGRLKPSDQGGPLIWFLTAVPESDLAGPVFTRAEKVFMKPCDFSEIVETVMKRLTQLAQADRAA